MVVVLGLSAFFAISLLFRSYPVFVCLKTNFFISMIPCFCINFRNSVIPYFNMKFCKSSFMRFSVVLYGDGQ